MYAMNVQQNVLAKIQTTTLYLTIIHKDKQYVTYLYCSV